MTKQMQTDRLVDQASDESSPPPLPQTELETEAAASARPDVAFPIVGIGASAGGLAAFEAFFAAMPSDTEFGMAVVLVQHLAPDHKSILSELVSHYTRMQVFEVVDGMEVQPNCTYIIPPNRDMALMNGRLHLVEQSAQRGLRLPIDFFFRSLARDQHERAICIVLSGTGSDGTLGLRAVKSEGGMVMAQTPDSTEYDGMPRSAIATGLVDHVLAPDAMPAQLIAYVQHAFGQKFGPVMLPLSKTRDSLNKIFVLLRDGTGHDFSHYKPNTIVRRVERRMAIQQIEEIDEYVRFLQRSPTEVEALFRGLLIGVTHFFRDPDAFVVLEAAIIPFIFANKERGAHVRVWVPGCSTGEEAYSIAILLYEQMNKMNRSYRVQIFATDIDSHAIAEARAGLFPASIAADISPQRLARFFTAEQDGAVYRIQKAIRDMLVISEQDVIQSPPFSRLDLLSCRNLLIYLDDALQKKIIPLFHYALNPHGLLFLGNSETVGEFGDLFMPLDRRWKLYQRQGDALGLARMGQGQILNRSPAIPLGVRLPTDGKLPAAPKVPLREMTERAILREYAHVGVLINAQGDILYIHGRTGSYLEPAVGEAHMNILSMARAGLQQPVTAALHKAVMTHATVRYPRLQLGSGNNLTTINLAVSPLDAEGGEKDLFVVVIEEIEVADVAHTPLAKGAVASNFSDESAKQIAALEQMLQNKDDYLQATLEEMASANEEFSATNEELQSVNEELQSTNEELETSKEEMQSLNEELVTLNAELQQRVADLSRANNDMNNLLAATGVGTIFVDEKLCIQRFTPAATQLINLIKTDIGRSVGHLASNLIGYDNLRQDAQAVLATLIPKDIEVQSQAGIWYLLSIRPYRTLENVIQGVVITFVDITRTKQAEVLNRLAAVVSDAHDAITLQDLEGRILAWNGAAERMYGWRENEALEMNIRDMFPEDQRADALTIVKQLSQSATLAPYRAQRLTKEGRTMEVLLTATALVNNNREVYAIATTERPAS